MKQRLAILVDRIEVNIRGRQNYRTIPEALKSLVEAGWFICWKNEDYVEKTWHLAAKRLGIKIATRQHHFLDCVVILRLE